MISKLPRYVGEAWRAESGYTHHYKVTAADVIRYETDDLGNDWPDSIPAALLRELESYPARDLIWVARTQEICRLYGEPSAFGLSSNARVVYEDDDGTLVLNAEPIN